MRSGKEALYRLAGLTLGLTCFGCFSTGDKQPAETPRPGAAANGPRPPASTQPVTQLKIPGPPAPGFRTSSSRPSDIVPVVAQGPDIAKPVDPAPRPQPFAPPTPPAAASDSGFVPPVTQAAQLRQLHQLAVQRYAAIDSYIARMRR